MKIKKILSAFMALTILCFTLSLFSCSGKDKFRIAVLAYKFDDSYIATVRSALENEFGKYDKEVTVTFYNGENNQQTQSTQLDTAITKGVDLLLINAVDFKAAGESLAQKADEKDIPVIFFNREVSDDAVDQSDDFCFVGTDPAAPGYMLGEMIAEMLGDDTSFERYDQNGDGKIQYAMFRAEIGNAEADGRTTYSVTEANRLIKENESLTSANKDGDVLVRVGADQQANWDSATANNMMGSLFRVENGKPNIELVICNNDDMALGVISALEAKGYNKKDSRENDPEHYIPVFGVDALSTAIDAMKNGKMQGTVKQDAEAMAKAIVEIAMNIKNDRDFLYGTDYTFDKDVRKLRIPYAPIKADEL